jgi:sigma-B regulation protein RsbU (phosphoserine phosphatase)
MKRRFLLIFIWLFFALTFINVVVTANRTVQTLRSIDFDQASDPGWRAASRRNRVTLVTVSNSGPAAQVLRAGDEIISINGHPQQNVFETEKLFRNTPPGNSYSIAIRRTGQILEFTLKTRPIPTILILFSPLVALIIPAIFMLSGLALLLLKPDDKLALLAALMFGSVIVLYSPGWLLIESKWLAAALSSAWIVSTFFFPIFCHFFLLFPDSSGSLSPLLRQFPKFEWYLYVPHLLTIFPFTVISFAYYFFLPESANIVSQKIPWAASIEVVVMVGYIVIGLLSLLINYREASRPLRRKMRVVVAGSLVGLLPMLLLIGFELSISRYQLSETLLLWLAVAAFSAFPLFPISFMYAIIRHQVIPVRLIIRRGVRHLFVRQGSVLLELVVVAVVLTVLLNYLLTRMQLSHLSVGIISGAVSIAVWQITRWLHYKVIAPAIDRAFFRRAYNAQLILSELGQALRVMSDWREETLAYISLKIQEALQTENVTIFLRDEKTGDYPRAISSQHTDTGQITVVSSPDLKLPRGAFVLQRLSESARSLKVEFNNPKSWAYALTSGDLAQNKLRQQEGEALREVNSALILPIATKDQLLGVISLGPRLGDLPFSREDQNFVKAVAAQLSFAIENLQLVCHKAEEARLRREFEFASKVQQRLFPQCPPLVAQLELSGVCHPARDVGGDYFDFLRLGDGQIGIAVADVSGKGLSAALLMSVVQASLRAQAPISNGRMTDLIVSMNRLLCESTDTSHYATFFYAQFDAESRRLTYVNAGHNPPILMRAGAGTNPLGRNPASIAMKGKGGGITDLGLLSETAFSEDEFCLLTTGGPVIGLLEDCSYEHGVIEMRRGDVLVAYTDGVSEAQNPEGEEFGERRLMQLVAAGAHLQADELRERIVESVRAWQRDAPQYDDMTMVIVKVR